MVGIVDKAPNPSAAERRGHRLGPGPEFLEVTELERHGGAAAGGLGKRSLDFGHEPCVLDARGVELPAEQEAVGRTPVQDRAPTRLAAFGVAFEPTPSGAGFDDDFSKGEFAGCAARRPPGSDPVREQVERLRGGAP